MARALARPAFARRLIPGERLQGLAPVEGERALWLVLGSMPSVASLSAGEYYAHPRNAFWNFAELRFGIARSAPYPERCRALTDAGVALWDVIGECEREGSLDSAIRDPVPNDFAAFFARHPELRGVLLNGGKATALFRKHAQAPPGISAIALPSTSPAHTRKDKLDEWHRAFDELGHQGSAASRRLAARN